MISFAKPEPSAADYLLFRLGTRRCALPRASVLEILPLPRLWRPPGLPRPLAGFMNLGGEAVPVLDLPRLFGLASTGAEAEAALYRHIMLTPDLEEGRRVALLVDRVLDVVRIPARHLRPVPPDATLNGCAVAEIELPDGFVHLLAVRQILLAREQAALAALREQEQARLAEWGHPGG